MTAMFLVLVAALMVMLVIARARRNEAGPTPQAAARATRPRRQSATVAKPPGPHRGAHEKVEPLEWDAPGGAGAPVASGNESRALMRDRYIAARFPGVFRGSADLRESDYVIRVARHYFEEGVLDRADELFALAIEQSPQDLPLRLAQLEIAYLGRDAGLFTRLAGDLRALHPDIPEWTDVVRLGHAIAPDEALFGARPDAHEHAQYGPWPDMPNWIQASWDLTAEVQAADFHRAMAERTRKAQRPALRRAA